MPFATVFAAQATFAKVTVVSVEADLSRGLHAFSIVGLPDKAVEEARDRISAAIKNSGFASPKSKNQKVVLSLAPSDIKKTGPIFDVPMALAYLLAADDIRFSPAGKIFLGELALDGHVRPIPGVLALAQAMVSRGFKELYVPAENAAEAALIGGLDIYPFTTLGQLIRHLNEKPPEEALEEGGRYKIKKYVPEMPTQDSLGIHDSDGDIDMSDIKGNAQAKRMLEIAAAGGHHCALWGPPGTGKTMLAKAFRYLLPDLSTEESLEVMAIHSIAGISSPGSISILKNRPPFRSPHHTASHGAIIGGGSNPKAGEITLAHRGVLFLDEFTEFNRQVIEALREPLEEGVVRISRIGGSVVLPAKIILFVALNPCPCGYFGSIKRECACGTGERVRYKRRLSGPIIDRIDLWAAVHDVEYEALSREDSPEERIRGMSLMRKKVREARAKQYRRTGKCNSDLTSREVVKLSIDPGARQLLISLSRKSSLSGRAHHRIMKIARTIADLEGKGVIDQASILEAFQYRPTMFEEKN